MKRLAKLALLLAAVNSVAGCSLVVCDRVFPHLTWYWTSEAERCRASHRLEKQSAKEWGDESNAYQKEQQRAKARYEASTNQVLNPK